MQVPLVITTSLKPKDPARRLAKFLSFIVKDARYYKRGKATLTKIVSSCNEWGARKLVVINQMKNGTVLTLKFYRVQKDTALEEPFELRLWNLIDHKIFGFRRFPGSPPISTGDKFQHALPELTEVLKLYFGLEVRRKTEIWVHADIRDGGNILQFVDPVTMRPFYEFHFSLRRKNTSS